MARLQVTDEMLRTAWAALPRRRTDDPLSFEAAMQDPLGRRLVRIEAIRRAQRQPHSVPSRHAPAPACPAAPLSPAHLDRKRAAAGERDDD